MEKDNVFVWDGKGQIPRDVEHVEIADNVTELPANLFNGDEESFDILKTSKVKTVTGMKNVEKIGEHAFAYCENLEEITIPDKVTELPYGVFMGCKNLKQINGLEHIEQIGVGVFAECEGLEEIKIPDKVKELSDYLFDHCKNLKQIDGMKNVTKIGEYAFYYCKGLEEITIPDTVTEIGDSAFSSCSNLKRAHGMKNVEKIGLHAFVDCEGLEEIKIPDKVTKLPYGVFTDCKNLKQIDGLDHVEKIDNAVFWNCASLKEVKLQRNAQSIENYCCSIYGRESPIKILYCGNDITKPMHYLATLAEHQKKSNEESVNAFNIIKPIVDNKVPLKREKVDQGFRASRTDTFDTFLKSLRRIPDVGVETDDALEHGKGSQDDGDGLSQ